MLKEKFCKSLILIFTGSNSHVLRPVELVLMSGVVDKLLDPSIDVVSVQLRIVFDGLAVTQNVEAKSRRRAVVVEEDSSKEILVPDRVRVPHHLGLFRHQPLVLLPVVQAAEEKTIESHVSEQIGLFSGVSEGIDLPSNAGNTAWSECVIQKPQPQRHLMDDVGVVWSSLVVHAPTAANKLQLAVVDEFPDFFFDHFILVFPPTPEESRFDLNVPETSLNSEETVSNCTSFWVPFRRIILQLLDNGVKHVSDARPLVFLTVSGPVRSEIILIDSF